ncbi:MAG: O-antigen ligase family protein [Aquabacterium sp.]
MGAGPTWPIWSVAALVVLAVMLPPALVTAMNLCLLLLAASHAIGRREGLPPALWGGVWPLVALAVLGVVSALLARALDPLHAASSGSDLYAVLKDGWYVINPAIWLGVGFVLSRTAGQTVRTLRALVLAAAVLAALHALWFVLFPQLLDLNATEIRGVSGTGHYAAAVALLILAAYRGCWGAVLRMPAALAWACALLCAVSVVVSFSRTMWVVVLLGMPIAAGWLSRRPLRRLVLASLAIAATVAVLGAVVDTSTPQARQSFLGKLARSWEELLPSDRMSLAEINANWRGHETARALATWAGGHAGHWVIGHGFGADVDVGLFKQLTPYPREAARYIPVLHNGFAYVLFKTGLLGLALYACFLWNVGRRGYRLGQGSRPEPGRLLLASAVVLLPTTWVVSGAFSRSDLSPLLLLIGVLLAAPPIHRDDHA